MRYDTTENQIDQENDWFDNDILWDDFARPVITGVRPGNLKKKAVLYIRAEKLQHGITRSIFRQVIAKARKLRISSKKAERAKDSQLTKKVNAYLNFHKK